MNALNRVRELAHTEPTNAHSEVFRELLESMEGAGAVCLAKLYDLDCREFELAVGCHQRLASAPAFGHGHQLDG
ncbi:MAG: hypothetical protein MZW92_47705 [Comamonadaceae bacterium]|nr:hypothetical protein [Comamonadaceae bacterium]